MKTIYIILILIFSFNLQAQTKTSKDFKVDLAYCISNKINNHPAMSYLALMNIGLIDSTMVSYEKFLNSKYLGLDDIPFENIEPVYQYFYNDYYWIYFLVNNRNSIYILNY